MRMRVALPMVLFLFTTGCSLRSGAGLKAPASVTPKGNAAEASAIPDQPATASHAARPGEVLRDIPYCDGEGAAHSMDLYYPQSGVEPYPVVVYVHGGAWSGGDKKGGVGMRFRDELLRRGYLFVSVNYRLAPKATFPAQIEDVQCAIGSLRAHADGYGLDGGRIGALGSSAGGHLVSLLGVLDEAVAAPADLALDESVRVQAVVDLFGPVDREVFCAPRLIGRVFGSDDCDDEVFDLASPLTFITPNDPPFLIMHGEEDAVVPFSQSERFYDALTQSGVKADLVPVSHAGHGFTASGGEIDPGWEELFTIVGDFFDATLKN